MGNENSTIHVVTYPLDGMTSVPDVRTIPTVATWTADDSAVVVMAKKEVAAQRMAAEFLQVTGVAHDSIVMVKTVDIEYTRMRDALRPFHRFKDHAQPYTRELLSAAQTGHFTLPSLQDGLFPNTNVYYLSHDWEDRLGEGEFAKSLNEWLPGSTIAKSLVFLRTGAGPTVAAVPASAIPFTPPPATSTTATAAAATTAAAAAAAAGAAATAATATGGTDASTTTPPPLPPPPPLNTGTSTSSGSDTGTGGGGAGSGDGGGGSGGSGTADMEAQLRNLEELLRKAEQEREEALAAAIEAQAKAARAAEEAAAATAAAAAAAEAGGGGGAGGGPVWRNPFLTKLDNDTTVREHRDLAPLLELDKALETKIAMWKQALAQAPEISQTSWQFIERLVVGKVPLSAAESEARLQARDPDEWTSLQTLREAIAVHNALVADPSVPERALPLDATWIFSEAPDATLNAVRETGIDPELLTRLREPVRKYLVRNHPDMAAHFAALTEPTTEAELVAVETEVRERMVADNLDTELLDSPGAGDKLQRLNRNNPKLLPYFRRVLSTKTPEQRLNAINNVATAFRAALKDEVSVRILMHPDALYPLDPTYGGKFDIEMPKIDNLVRLSTDAVLARYYRMLHGATEDVTPEFRGQPPEVGAQFRRLAYLHAILDSVDIDLAEPDRESFPRPPGYKPYVADASDLPRVAEVYWPGGTHPEASIFRDSMLTIRFNNRPLTTTQRAEMTAILAETRPGEGAAQRDALIAVLEKPQAPGDEVVEDVDTAAVDAFIRAYETPRAIAAVTPYITGTLMTGAGFAPGMDPKDVGVFKSDDEVDADVEELVQEFSPNLRARAQFEARRWRHEINADAMLLKLFEDDTLGSLSDPGKRAAFRDATIGALLARRQYDTVGSIDLTPRPGDSPVVLASRHASISQKLARMDINLMSEAARARVRAGSSAGETRPPRRVLETFEGWTKEIAREAGEEIGGKPLLSIAAAQEVRQPKLPPLSDIISQLRTYLQSTARTARLNYPDISEIELGKFGALDEVQANTQRRDFLAYTVALIERVATAAAAIYVNADNKTADDIGIEINTMLDTEAPPVIALFNPPDAVASAQEQYRRFVAAAALIMANAIYGRTRWEADNPGLDFDAPPKAPPKAGAAAAAAAGTGGATAGSFAVGTGAATGVAFRRVAVDPAVLRVADRTYELVVQDPHTLDITVFEGPLDLRQGIPWPRALRKPAPMDKLRDLLTFARGPKFTNALFQNLRHNIDGIASMLPQLRNYHASGDPVHLATFAASAAVAVSGIATGRPVEDLHEMRLDHIHELMSQYGARYVAYQTALSLWTNRMYTDSAAAEHDYRAVDALFTDLVMAADGFPIWRGTELAYIVERRRNGLRAIARDFLTINHELTPLEIQYQLGAFQSPENTARRRKLLYDMAVLDMAIYNHLLVLHRGAYDWGLRLLTEARKFFADLVVPLPPYYNIPALEADLVVPANTLPREAFIDFVALLAEHRHEFVRIADALAKRSLLIDPFDAWERELAGLEEPPRRVFIFVSIKRGAPDTAQDTNERYAGIKNALFRDHNVISGALYSIDENGSIMRRA